MPQVGGAGFDGRKPLDVLGRVPGQDRGVAIDASVAEPRLGGGNQAAGGEGSLFAGVEPNRVGWRTAAPGKPQGTRRRLGRRRLIMERRQRLARFDLAGRHQLRDGEVLNPPRCLGGIDVGDGGVGRPQIHAHDITGRWRRFAHRHGVRRCRSDLSGTVRQRTLFRSGRCADELFSRRDH